MSSKTITEPIDFGNFDGGGHEYCSGCNGNYVYLCADCWSKMPQERRDALHPRVRIQEVRVEVERHETNVHHHTPIPRLWQVLVGAAVVSLVSGVGGAVLVLWRAGVLR